jgi:hypothetical protein
MATSRPISITKRPFLYNESWSAQIVTIIFGVLIGASMAAEPETGWQSEDFSAQASEVLSTLGESLKTGDPSKVTVSGKIGALRPATSSILNDSGFWVRRMTEKHDAVEVKAPWDSLLEPFAGKLDRMKFKVVSVDLKEPKSPVSRQLVTLAGTSAGGYLEQNATWRIAWNWDGVKAPIIRDIAVEAFEEVLAKSASRQPIFADATLDVIGQTQAFREQLRFGNTYWRQRIELFNRYFKFGHHGLAIGDANGDGLDDVYVCQNGGLPNRLFIQQPDGTALDVASEVGVDLLDLTRSALFVDLDNDGDQDLVLAADSGLLAFRNNGAGRFEAMLRYKHVRNAFSVTAADYDNDGDLDLYVCRYFANQEEGAGLAVPVPYFDANNGGGNFLIRNDGPAVRAEEWLGFSDATKESGLDSQNNNRFSFAAVWEDIDRDGDQDLFVANDFGQKNLYINEGGQFNDTALNAGIDDGGFGMSACSGDYDGDGLPDLYAGNMFSAAGSRVTQQPQFRPGLAPETLSKFQRMARGNSLFRNIGKRRFDDVSEMAGVTVGRWSWGSVFADLNNDGWQDLVVANGYVTGRVPDDL